MKLTCLPNENGTYLYLIMCRICRFIVRTKRTIQYISRIGQKTGTSKMGKKVMKKAMMKAFVTAYLRAWNGTVKSHSKALFDQNEHFPESIDQMIKVVYFSVIQSQAETQSLKVEGQKKDPAVPPVQPSPIDSV
jgi:hypothetical protein